MKARKEKKEQMGTNRKQKVKKVDLNPNSSIHQALMD